MRSSQPGFSLVELLVGIALLAIILRIAIPGVSDLIQNAQIRGAAEAIQDGLQLARTEALRRNRIVRFQLTTGTGWQVGCATEDTTTDAAGEQLCPGTIQARTAQDGSSNAAISVAQLVATTGAPAASPVFNGTLEFNGLGRATTATLPAGNNGIYRITNPVGGSCAASGGDMRCLSVLVTPGGQIRMCDPAVASGDPRAC